jgi:hypothetical protein
MGGEDKRAYSGGMRRGGGRILTPTHEKMERLRRFCDAAASVLLHRKSLVWLVHQAAQIRQQHIAHSHKSLVYIYIYLNIYDVL